VLVVSDGIFRAVPAPLRRASIRLLKALNARVRRRAGTMSVVLPLPDVWHSDPVLFWRPSWSTEIFRALLQVRGGAFVDVGANMGQSMLDLLFIESSRTYVGFEPNPICAGYLSQLVAENGLSNASIIASAIGREAALGVLYLHRGRATDDAATLIYEVRPNRPYFKQLVPILPLDLIYWRCTLESPALIKVDAEGAELEILQGMSGLLKHERPPVVCEVLFADKDADSNLIKTRNDQLMHLLSQNCYNVFQIIKTAKADKINSLRQVSSFSSAVFSEENRHFCDYVFVPEEAVEELSSMFKCAA
jgi:FkbM family methyltransferase